MRTIKSRKIKLHLISHRQLNFLFAFSFIFAVLINHNDPIPPIGSLIVRELRRWGLGQHGVKMMRTPKKKRNVKFFGWITVAGYELGNCFLVFLTLARPKVTRSARCRPITIRSFQCFYYLCGAKLVMRFRHRNWITNGSHYEKPW